MTSRRNVSSARFLATLAVLAVLAVGGQHRAEAQVNAADLEALDLKYHSSFEKVWDDAGSGSIYVGSVYKPTNIPAGYFALGQIAFGPTAGVCPASGTYPTQVEANTRAVLVAKPLRAGALAPPVDFKFLGDNSGTKSKTPVSWWQPIPPKGYRALGHVFAPGRGAASKPPVSSIMCVQEGLCVKGKSGKMLYADRGSGGTYNLSIFGVVPGYGDPGLNVGTIITSANHYNGSPPAIPDEVYTLAADPEEEGSKWHYEAAAFGTSITLSFHKEGKARQVASAYNGRWVTTGTWSQKDNTINATFKPFPWHTTGSQVWILDIDGGTAKGRNNTDNRPVWDFTEVQKTAKPTPAYIEEAIAKYGPVVYLHPEEKYFPISVQEFIDGSNVVRQAEDLKAPAPGPGQADTRKFIRRMIVKDEKTFFGNLPKARSCVMVRHVHYNFTDLQFWFFYGMNGPTFAKFEVGVPGTADGLVEQYLNNCNSDWHDGDWCHITVRLDNKTRLPAAVGYTSHGDTVWYSAASTRTSGSTQTRVYSALHMHGSYPTPGTNFELANWTTKPIVIPKPDDWGLVGKVFEYTTPVGFLASKLIPSLPSAIDTIAENATLIGLVSKAIPAIDSGITIDVKVFSCNYCKDGGRVWNVYKPEYRQFVSSNNSVVMPTDPLRNFQNTRWGRNQDHEDKITIDISKIANRLGLIGDAASQIVHCFPYTQDSNDDGPKTPSFLFE